MQKDSNRGARLAWTCALVLWVAFMWGHSLANGDASSLESSHAVAILRPILNALGIVGQHEMTYAVRKTAHFCEYALMGILLWQNGRVRRMDASRGSGWWVALALAIPVCDEFIQSFVPGRSSMVSDVVLDFCGACFGLLVALGLRRLVRSR